MLRLILIKKNEKHQRCHLVARVMEIFYMNLPAGSNRHGLWIYYVYGNTVPHLHYKMGVNGTATKHNKFAIWLFLQEISLS